VGLRAGLDTEARGKILCLCLGPDPGRPVCSQTLLTELPQLTFQLVGTYKKKSINSHWTHITKGAVNVRKRIAVIGLFQRCSEFQILPLEAC
jgi:hypothetical protein